MINISASTSECKEIFTLNLPIDFISFSGCIIEGLTSILLVSEIIFEISVGFTEPYNSLFSVLSLFTVYSFLLIFSEIFLAFCFFSSSFLERSDLIFSTCFIFSLEACKALLLAIKKLRAKPLLTSIASPIDPILFKFSNNILS
jgi:hypothetical protein